MDHMFRNSSESSSSSPCALLSNQRRNCFSIDYMMIYGCVGSLKSVPKRENSWSNALASWVFVQ